MLMQTGLGPASTKQLIPNFCMAVKPASNETHPRKCFTQNSAVVRASPVATAPVRFEITVVFGAAYVIVLATAANSSRIGSITGEWNAFDVCSSLCLTPSRSNCCSTFATAAFLPEITTLPGPFTAAMATSPAYGATAAATRFSVANTATITPSRGTLSISRARAAMSFRPSSRLKTPATHAATNSPTLWPMSAVGSTPHDIHSCAREYSTANSAG